MTAREFELPEAVRRKVLAQGADGMRWLNGLDGLIRDLERDWDIAVGATLHGGSEALVAEVVMADGTEAVIKLGIPGSTAFDNEIRTLLLADGRGYAQLLRHDAARGVMLQERLGKQLAQLGLAVSAQIRIICATLQAAWIVVPDTVRLQTGAEKARYLGDFIATSWDELDRPCSERAVERALVFADARVRAFDPAASVLVHGDAHSANTLQIIGTRSAQDSGFKFVDPDGMFAERACDLAVPMRSWSRELLAGDALQLGRARCVLLNALTGAPSDAIWQWGFMERMSTGLYLLQLGWGQMGRDMLRVADAWAQDA
jgi:streptomycin 6-kinase